jgi:hypothetical protein
MDDFKQYLLFQKAVTESKLKTINRFLKKIESKPRKQTIDALARPRRITKTNLMVQILKDAGRPMTLNEIAEIAVREHNVQMKRDSMSSILTKKIQAGIKFIRTGPNTFALKGES